ncbi:hypothetical protein SAMD00079811_48910 [Scytonema sp. HK-05]|nr:hypothetical protein SAMD00079811_48910 [Scytonema sp. HK-05]
MFPLLLLVARPVGARNVDEPRIPRLFVGMERSEIPTAVGSVKFACCYRSRSRPILPVSATRPGESAPKECVQVLIGRLAHVLDQQGHCSN